jgi:eukaryotic-like serine/threonine-protein kinase
MLLDGRYSLVERIGAGGFCEVWRAADTLLMRPVAVKLLHASYADQPEVRARLRAEARHAGALSHQNIARVYDYGEPARGQSYLVMELLEGPSLAAVLAGGPLGAARAMDIVAQVADGLHTAHSAGLIHRDIKPANIMFTADGTARITDFGIAHAVGSAPLTVTGTMLGTPGYLAPERIAGAQAGPASDLYALGIVAYECLTGTRPFSGPPLEVAFAHREGALPPLPASLPAGVAALVRMLTAKDPAARPGSAGEVACDARRLRDELSAGPAAERPAPASAPLAPGAGGPALAGVPLTINGAQEGGAMDTARFRTSTARSGRPGRPGRPRRARVPSGAALATLTALTCLALLAVTWLALGSHSAGPPSSGPPRAARPGTTSPSRSPEPARHHGPSATPIGAAAAVRHTSARHPAAQPGPRHQNRPTPGNAPSPAPSPGGGPSPDPSASPSPAPSGSPSPGPSSSPSPGPDDSASTAG